MSSKRVLAIQKKLKEKKEQEEINERLRDEAEIQLKMEKIKERRKKPQQKKRKIVERKKSRLEMTLKEVKQEKRDVKERKELVRKKSLETEEKLKKEKQEEIDRKSQVLIQPKKKEEKGKKVRKDSTLVKRIKRENLESKKERESLEELKQKALRLIKDKENKILGSGIVFSTGNTIESRTLAGKIKGQPESICKGVFPLSIAEVSNGSSVSFISRGKVLAILTYTNRVNFIKINTLCSTGGRGGSKLLKALEGKFSKQFRLDSVPSAIPFWKKVGFSVIGEEKTGTKTTKMVKN